MNGSRSVVRSIVSWPAPRVGVLAGLSLLTMSAAAYEIAPASVTPVIMAELGIGPVAVSWIVSVMLATAVTASIPVGMGLDRVRVRTAILTATVALVASGVGAWQAALHGAYWLLLGTRILGALAYITIWNASLDAVGGAFGADTRATALGAYTASGTAGFALGQFAGPLVTDALGWTAIFVAFAALAVVGLAVFWPASAGLAIEGQGEAPDPTAFRRVFTNRPVWLVCGMGFMAYSTFLFVNSWMPSYLSDGLGLSLAQSGLLVALFPAAGMLSRVVGGVLSDRLFGGRRRPVTLLSFAVTAPTVVGLALIDAVTVLLVLLLVAGFSVQLGLGVFYTYLRELVDPEVMATAIALLSAVGLSGAFSAPVIAGWLIEQTGAYAAAFGYAVLVSLAGLALAWTSPEPNPGR